MDSSTRCARSVFLDSRQAARSRVASSGVNHRSRALGLALKPDTRSAGDLLPLLVSKPEQMTQERKGPVNGRGRQRGAGLTRRRLEPLRLVLGDPACRQRSSEDASRGNRDIKTSDIR